MGKHDLVLLHGWGKQGGDYSELIGLLEERFAVYAPDLPGFGAEPLKRPMDLNDYAKWLMSRLSKKKINRPILVGHSFGGRVAIEMAVLYPMLIDKLILVDSGGIERKTAGIKFLRVLSGLSPNWLKKLLLPYFGSNDYLKSSGALRETLKRVVAKNLEFDLPKVKVPTFIVWGRDDHTTPLWQGELMHKLIPGSRMLTIAGDHGIPYREAAEVAKAILEFL